MPRSVRRVLSPLAGALLLLQAVVVPALEATDAGPRAVLESQHDASCLVGHDHSICTQTGANRALSARTVAHPFAVLSVAMATLLQPSHPPLRALERGGRPRAPPTA